MLANFLIGLREGLEAALVVSILVAFLVRTERTDRLRDVWLGVGAAVGLSFALGAVLTLTSSTMPHRAQEAFGGVMSIIAVGLVTWMIFWMRRTSRFLKRELEGKMTQALSLGRAALVLMAFVAVAREGLETSLFVWSTTQATSGATSFLGALLGLVTAAALGYLLYKSAVRINLATFFKWTSIALVVVAAGVLAYGFHDLQEAGWLPGEHSIVFDVSAQVSLSSWYGALLKGAFNWNPAPTYVELTAWASYLAVVMAFLLWPASRRQSAVKPAEAVSAER